MVKPEKRRTENRVGPYHRGFDKDNGSRVRPWRSLYSAHDPLPLTPYPSRRRLEPDRRCPARYGRDSARPPFRQFLFRRGVTASLCLDAWAVVQEVMRSIDGHVPVGQRGACLDRFRLLDRAGGNRCRGNDERTRSHDRLTAWRRGVSATPSTAGEKSDDRDECP